jgi:hypothetical protein
MILASLDPRPVIVEKDYRPDFQIAKKKTAWMAMKLGVDERLLREVVLASKTPS